MKMTPEALAALSQTPFFQSLDTATISTVLQGFTLSQVSTTEYLFYQGDKAGCLFVLLSGQIKVIQNTPDGQQVVMRLINPYEIFGCVAALSQGEYPGSAEVTRDAEVLFLPAQQISKLMQTYPLLAYNGFQIMVERVHELQDRYRELATENVAHRLVHTLLRLMKHNGKPLADGGILLDLPLSRQNLAEMTGTTLYTVSRLLQVWVSQGLIQTGREKVVLLKPEALAAQVAEAAEV